MIPYSSYLIIFRRDPLAVIKKALIIMAICIAIGFGIPLVGAYVSNVIDEDDISHKMETSSVYLKNIHKEVELFKTYNDSLKLSIKKTEELMLEYNNHLIDSDFISTSLKIRELFIRKLNNRKSPYIISGFFESSTIILWPMILTCLSCLLFIFSPPKINNIYPRKNGYIIFFILYTFYRGPIILRNILPINKGRVFFGHANLDIDPIGFLIQEVLGLIVTILITRIWLRWASEYITIRKKISSSRINPVYDIFNRETINVVSYNFLHWQICSVIIVGAFIGYSYLYWKYIFVIGDPRYIFNGIIIHILWLLTWLLITLPLLAVWHHWQSMKSQALYAIIEKKKKEELDVNSLVSAINELQPISFFNLTVSGIGVIISFILPIVQVFVK